MAALQHRANCCIQGLESERLHEIGPIIVLHVIHSVRVSRHHYRGNVACLSVGRDDIAMTIGKPPINKHQVYVRRTKECACVADGANAAHAIRFLKCRPETLPERMARPPRPRCATDWPLPRPPRLPPITIGSPARATVTAPSRIAVRLAAIFAALTSASVPEASRTSGRAPS